MTDRRELAPPLEFPLPPCPVCGRTVDLGEIFSCGYCKVTWPVKLAHLRDGRWDNPDTPQCASAYREGICSYHCILDAGHTGKHRHPDLQEGWLTEQQVGVAR